MKAVAVFMLLAFTAQLTNADNVNYFKDDLVSKNVARSIGDRIKEFLENFKETMKTGDESKGIPPMDPFKLKHQEIHVEQELLNAIGEVNNLHVEGISDFKVQHADFKMGKKNLSINLMWPTIRGNVLFNITEAKIMDYIPIFGIGDAKFEVTNLTFATNTKLKLDFKNKNVTIVEFSNTTISLDALKLDAKGLFDNEEFSELISDIISNIAPQFLIDFQEELVTEVDKLMFELGNQLLPTVVDTIWGIIMP